MCREQTSICLSHALYTCEQGSSPRGGDGAERLLKGEHIAVFKGNCCIDGHTDLPKELSFVSYVIMMFG